MWHDIWAPILVTVAGCLGSIGVFYIERRMVVHFRNMAFLANSANDHRKRIESLEAWRTRTLRRTADKIDGESNSEIDAPSSRRPRRIPNRDGE